MRLGPGKAAVVTSRVHIRKGEWKGESILSGRPVAHISAFLSDQEEWTPQQLKANAGKSFIGSYVLGMGFIVSEEEAQDMVFKNSKNNETLFPYLNGKDLNSAPEQLPSRWVINFWDWPEDKAKQYLEPYNHLKENVYPERYEKSKKYSYRNIMSMWWLHWNNRPGLYTAIGRGHVFLQKQKKNYRASQPMEKVLVCARVSKTGAFVFVDNDSVFSDQVIIIATDRYEEFSLMQSSIHVAYAWKHSSHLKSDMRYTPTDVFETYPFPLDGDHSDLGRLGEKYHSLRAEFMHGKGIGLTKLYNHFHDPDEDNPHIRELRGLHRQIDEAVAEAYGWGDLDLEHEFHEVDYLPENDRVRFTISEPARIEVLCRLAALNRERFNAKQASTHRSKSEASLSRSVERSRGVILSPKPDIGDLFGSAVESAQSDCEQGQP